MSADMSDSEIQKIRESIGFLSEITINYKSYGVFCLIDVGFHDISISSSGKTQQLALESGLKKLEKLKEIQKETKIIVPDLSNQPYNNGYYDVMVDKNHRFSYKRINNKFYLEFIDTMVFGDFVLKDPPVKVGDFKTAKSRFIKKDENGDLYEWNNIAYLCGMSGLAYVRDGYVIATKTTKIA